MFDNNLLILKALYNQMFCIYLKPIRMYFQVVIYFHSKYFFLEKRVNIAYKLFNFKLLNNFFGNYKMNYFNELHFNFKTNF